MANDITSWSTTANDNATLDGLTWAEGQAASSVNNSARQMMASIKAWYNNTAGGKVAGGTANAITLTSDVGFTALGNGIAVTFKASADNSGATTLNVNALGAKSVRKMTLAGDVALVGGEIQDDGIYTVYYSTDANSASGGWILHNPTNVYPTGQGATVASASTLTLGNDGSYYFVSGTTTITAISTAPAGTTVTLRFLGSLTLTHNGTSLVLPGAANIITAVNDVAIFASEGSGNWRCVSFQNYQLNGTWTPTLTNTTNVSSSTALDCYYMRQGGMVWCFGNVNIAPSVGAPTTTTLGISLPIASNLAAATDLAGTAVSTSVLAIHAGKIAADATNDRATLTFAASSTTTLNFSFTFAYRVL